MSTSFNCAPSRSAIAGAMPWTLRCDRSARRSVRRRDHDGNHTRSVCSSAGPYWAAWLCTITL